MSLKINEIFYSIQGESLFAGLPCVFVRLSGCNLRCAYCDTAYAYEEGLVMPLGDIINRIAGYDGCRLVEITGGEPLIQKDTPLLVNELIDGGYRVLIETNGSMDIGRLNPKCIKIMDIKCPSSNESNSLHKPNLMQLKDQDQVKFVISDETDYRYAKQMLPMIQGKIPGSHILFSPVHGILSPDQLARWILSDHLGVRLHLQLHKVIWPGVERGV